MTFAIFILFILLELAVMILGASCVLGLFIFRGLAGGRKVTIRQVKNVPYRLRIEKNGGKSNKKLEQELRLELLEMFSPGGKYHDVPTLLIHNLNISQEEQDKEKEPSVFYVPDKNSDSLVITITNNIIKMKQ